MKFADLGLSPALLRAVTGEGYETPTPIQQQAIPHVLAGRDVLGCAQTGTGKTAAFALPILDRLTRRADGVPLAPPVPSHTDRVPLAPPVLSQPQSPDPHWQSQCHTKGAKPKTRSIRALVLSPTRELALQIFESFRAYGRHTGMRAAAIYGGVGQNPQVRALRAGVDVLVATPGRLMDLMGQRLVDLRGVEVFVLDEADRMLDMGFMPDVKRIITAIPAKRQNLLFSATMPGDIRSLADAILRDPVRVQVAAESSPIEAVEQQLYYVDKRNKPVLLTHLLTRHATGRVLVFTRTKHGADKVVLQIRRAGIAAEAIHGNKSQGARQKALARFKSNQPPVLVATDIAARGLDIDNISHVVNFDLPNVAETYIHRIGRTGRAGATGVAVSFCAGDERDDLKAIERLMKRRIDIRDDHPVYPARAESHDGPALPRANERGAPKAKLTYREGQAVGDSQRPSNNRRRRKKPGTTSNFRHHNNEAKKVAKVWSGKPRRAKRPAAAGGMK